MLYTDTSARRRLSNCAEWDDIMEGIGMNGETKVSDMTLENPEIVARIKQIFAPDGGAEREHNATAGSLGFGLIHYSLITNIKPTWVLAIGSRYGYIPSIMGLALKTNGAGKLDFVDANYDDSVHGFTTAFGGVGYWTEPEKSFSSLGLEETVRIHIMRTADFFEHCEANYGYIYIDGDHSYEGCLFDFEHALKVAEPGAYFVLHDVLVDQPGFGVNRVFNELNTNSFDKTLISVWPGLAIIRRKA